MSILGDLQKQNGGAWVELYELDATAQGGSVLYFHAGTNGLNTSVVWQGNTYAPFPINATGFEISGQQMPRPKLAVANVSGAITALLQTSDLLGAKVTRRRTMVKYLDAVNFPTQRNLLTYTEDFSNAAWAKTSVSVTPNQILSPTGEMTADKLQTTVASNPNVYRSFSAPVNTLEMAFSFYCMAGNINSMVAQLYANGGNGNITHAAQILSGPGSVSGTGGIAINITGLSTTQFTRVLVRSTGNTNTIGSLAAYIKNRTTGSVIGDYTYIWGAQVEFGTTATDYQPVLGATFSRNPTADANSHLPDEIYYVAQKTQENHAIVEFELGSPIDLEGVTIPRRQIVANLCLWQYRGDGCGYAGGAVADEFDMPTAVLANDKCSKRLSGCTLRFGSNSELPYGGFPSAGLTKL